MQLPDLVRQLRHDLKQIAHDAVVRDFEDRRVFVLVDRDDDLRRPHSREVLDRPGNTDRKVERRAHRFPGLTDLVGVWAPAGIDDGTRRPDGRAAAERLRQILQHLEVGGLLEPATAGNDDLRFGDVEHPRGRGLYFTYDHTTGRRDGECLGFFLRRPCVRREDVGPHRHDGRLSEHTDLLQRLARVYRSRRNDSVALGGEVGDIGRNRNAELRRDSWREIFAGRRRGEYHDAVATGFGAFRDSGGACLGAGRATDDSIDLRTDAPRSGRDFERDLTEHAVPLLENREHAAHRTFASSRSSRTSSPTAAGPSPTILPSLRSGGGVSAMISSLPAAACTGFTSSGFFLAAMIPLSAG